MNTTNTTRAIGAVIATVAVLALAGCGGSSGSSASAKVASLNGSGGTTTTVKPGSTTDFRTALLAYAKCMRAHGVDFPDPQFDANGRPQFGFRGQGGSTEGGGANGNPTQNRDNPTFQKARQACQSILDKVRGSFQPTPEQLAQMRTRLLAFAKCMRGQGIDFPDPTFDANGRPQFGQNGANGKLRDLRNDPKTQKAFETCRQQVGGNGGPGFGFFGGGPRGGNGGSGGSTTPPPPA